jgi:RNA polymerase sigma-70 factor (ECF subfamily)
VTPLQAADDRDRFEQALLPHLGAAYNLARWLTRDEHDAEDVVQEAYFRALKSFSGFHGTDGRAWLLAIVRNACYTWLQQRHVREPAKAFDEEIHSVDTGVTPVSLLMQEENKQTVHQVVEELPAALREVIVLRELEGLSYKEIAAIADIPMGTVMSRLARARERTVDGRTDIGAYEVPAGEGAGDMAQPPAFALIRQSRAVQALTPMAAPVGARSLGVPLSQAAATVDLVFASWTRQAGGLIVAGSRHAAPHRTDRRPILRLRPPRNVGACAVPSRGQSS